MDKISHPKFGPWWSYAFFSWVRPTLVQGKKTPHTEHTALGLLRLDSCKTSAERLEQELEHSRNKKRPLAWAILRFCKGSLILGNGLFFIHVISQTLTALLLRSLVLAYQGQSDGDYLHQILPADGATSILVIAGLLFSSSLVTSLTAHHAFWNLLRMAMRVRSAITFIIYSKALRLSHSSRGATSTGHVINLISADLGRLWWFITFLYSPLAHSLQIALVTYFLYLMLGWAVFVGIGTMITLLLSGAALARLNILVRKRLLEVSDRRISVMNEILSNIRVIKLYGWEKSFFKYIGELRDSEVRFLTRLAAVAVGLNTVFTSTPLLIGAATFSTIAWMGNLPPLADALSAIVLFSLLRWAMMVIPEVIVGGIETNVGVKRMESFLALPEHKALEKDGTLKPGTIILRNVSANWSSESEAIRDVSLQVKPGEMICIVGGVGSGKSALLNVFMSELPLSSGEIYLNGGIAYVSQQPWIVNDTLRNNIILGQEWNEERYNRCLKASALTQDISEFPAGDLTEIGERGINLSGGQKQRVSLARAAYANADIYLFDDTLSALDGRVGKQVAEELINGLLREKTRILVTHRLEYTQNAERIVLMELGKIAETGSLDELLRLQGRFKSLLGELSQEEDRTHTSVHGDIRFPAPQNFEGQESQDNSAITVTEERREGKVLAQTYRNYLSAFAPGVIAPIILVVFVLKELSGIASDGWLSWWASQGKFNLDIFGKAYTAMVIGAVLIVFLRTLLARYRGLKAGTNFHNKLLFSVLGAPTRFFDSNPVGRILNRFSSDMEAIDQQIPVSIIDVLTTLTSTALMLLFIIVLNPILILGVLPLLFIYYRLQGLFRPTSRECQRMESISRSPIFAQYSESLAGIPIIRAFNWQETFLLRLEKNLDVYHRFFYTYLCANRWLAIRLDALGASVTFFAAICPILVAPTMGVPFSGLAVTNSIVMVGGLNWLIRMFSLLESNMSTVERLEHFSKIEPENWEGEEPPASWPTVGRIEIRGISARYRENLPFVLKSITASIKGGEKIGIVGRTGSGKSTLVQVLCRLLEAEQGDILIDGVNTRETSLEAVRLALAVIPQDPVMFSGTLRRNLDPFNRYSDIEIWEALGRVDLQAYVHELPSGLDAPVQENGSNFSVGQKQLICLARALLRRNRIIILDEATASVDAATDRLIQRTIREEFKHCTVITIAHRINTISDYDKIMVLENGELTDFDTPDKVFRRAGERVKTWET